MIERLLLSILLLSISLTISFGFVFERCHYKDTNTRYGLQRSKTQLDAVENKEGSSSYESSASVTKSIVSSLTSLTNSIFEPTRQEDTTSLTIEQPWVSQSPPSSPQQLLTRIQDEYIENNYLWTGKLDTSSFVSNCTFTDPTLSFVGVKKFVSNVGNLVPVVNYLLGDDQDEKSSQSILLDISLNEEEQYVETRWNMLGKLDRLFWRPKIDVIGKTKFWYKEITEGEEKTYQVYFYDEMWEIPAGLALLQLVTPAGTIANTR